MANEDVLITPASEKIEFKQGDPQAVYGLITGDGTSLVLSGANDLILKGSPVYTYAADGEADNSWLAWIQNAEATDDYNYGLRISAGSTGNDTAFFVQDHDASNDYFVIRGDGDIGIGTTAPTNLLTVSGAGSPLRLYGTSTGKVEFDVSTSGDFTIDADDDIRLDPGGNDIVLYGAGTEYARLTYNGGHMSISTTTQFQVDSGDDVNLDANSSVFNFKRQGTEMVRLTAGASTPILWSTKIDDYSTRWADYDDVTQLFLEHGGNVGIGTTTPGHNLDVYMADTSGNPTINISDGVTYLRSYISDGAAYVQSDDALYLWTRGTGQYAMLRAEDGYVEIKASSYINFKPGDADAVRMLANGNVGIGTTAPSYNLDVVGTTQLSGAATFTGGEFIKDPENKSNTSFTVGDESCYYVAALGLDGADTTVLITLPSSGITDGAKYDLLCQSVGHDDGFPPHTARSGTINIIGKMNGNASATVQINTASGIGNFACNVVTAQWSYSADTWFVSKQTMIS